MKTKTTIGFTIFAGLLGAGIGYSLFYLLNAKIIPIIIGQSFLFIFSGTIIGTLVGFALIKIRLTYQQFSLEEVKLSIPEFSEMTFRVNNEYRQVAWNLFIETITRIATQPLTLESGSLREALNSLYSLFSSTRDLLKEMRPTSETKGTTVEYFAVSMLNDVLRPFLAKWHPLLTEFESIHGNEPETRWEHNQQFREELEKLRLELIKYTRGFGEIAGVYQLDKYF